MNSSKLIKVFFFISEIMTKNKDYLTKLDQQSGDGDLGVSMTNGFKSVYEYLSTTDETDIGRLFMLSSSVFNDTAPSSLGTIISFALMGMAQSLKGKTEASLNEMASAMKSGVGKVMDRAGSKPGEKTVLDSMCPAIDTLIANVNQQGAEVALKKAVEASKKGAEDTRQMRSVHGRAAYYGDKSIGLIDGGAVVGSLIFEALYNYVTQVVKEVNK